MATLSRRSPNHFGLLLTILEGLVSAASSLHGLLEKRIVPSEASTHIADLEQQGDKLVQRLNHKLRSYWILPVDREDFFELSNRIDDVLDCINGISHLIAVFKVEVPIPSASNLAEILKKATIELLKATKALSETKVPSGFFANVKTLTEEAEEVYLRGQEIFMANAPDPSSLIKQQRICERLETAVTLSQEAARTIERIAIKHR